MIISRTPYRLSFFGGGTDYPAWYKEFGGKVIGSSIDKFCYISCRYLPPFFEHKFRIAYSKIETVQNPNEINHPSVKAVLNYFDVSQGLEIHHDGDIPGRSGMGTSSSFTVGLLNVLHALFGKLRSKEDLYKEAIYIEQDVIKENVGSQDQVFAAVGGLNTIEFLQNGEILIEPIIISEKILNLFEKNFLLFFTGIHRISSIVAKEQIDNISKNHKVLLDMKQLVDEAKKVLIAPGKNFGEFGKLLNQNWLLKKRLASNITTERIDAIYDTAIKNGALGGKILGAGNGGFILFYAEPEYHEAIKNSLKGLINIPFRFDFSGSKIIIYQPNYFHTNRVN